jgi:hypothetical protein
MNTSVMFLFLLLPVYLFDVLIEHLMAKGVRAFALLSVLAVVR